MPHNNSDFLSMLLLLLVAVVSGIISILRRIERGQVVSVVWALGEFLAAILAAYLAFDVYKANKAVFPTWATAPVIVAVAAHMGGRMLQSIENVVYSHFSQYVPSRRKEDRREGRREDRNDEL